MPNSCQPTQTIDNNSSAMPSHERLLPLEGGNNFRDFGGYKTENNKTVKRGLLFRSGVMTSLTKNDQQLLDKVGIKTIVDFRSKEELDLFPNHWAQQDHLCFSCHNYSISEFYRLIGTQKKSAFRIVQLYEIFPQLLIPQLRLWFGHLIAGESPAVVNCSAGQDRTGMASALVLHTLGVPWQTILEDYHLSTLLRRPDIEHKGLDTLSKAGDNEFSQMMLRYGNGDKTPEPLLTEDNTPFLQLAFDKINQQYGSVTNYLEQEINVDSQGIARLKALYLH